MMYFREKLVPQYCDPPHRALDAARRWTSAAALVLVLGVSAIAFATAANNQAATGSTPKAQEKAAPSIAITVDPKDAADATDDDASTAAKPHRGATVHIQSGDRDFDSFADAMQSAPWLVGLVFLVVGSIFLTPLILLVGIIWYKLRKTRLQNDALLKLAERGVVPSAQVADAVASGTTLSPPSPPTSDSSGFQRAVSARRRAVWSDLRKGVILTMIGLSFVFYSMTESGSANWVGLLLMFLGIGYVALWWLEDRHLQQRETPPGPGGGTN